MTERPLKISVIGLGKLGTPLAACFAWKGFSTIGVDNNLQRVEAVNQRRSPIYEPRVEELIQASEGRLTATDDCKKAVLNTDVTFILVPTPSEKGGSFSLKHVLQTAEQIGDALRTKTAYHLVVLTSTVMPGSTENEVKPFLEKRSGKKCGKDFGFCYSPEFVALGTVIRDFLTPDFILIGESDPHAGSILEGLYKDVCENNPPVARMNFVNAELTKLAVNTFVTTKITFANMLARICEKLAGADIDVVSSTLGLDSRIGKKYLKGSIGYGGPCFPRDNRALAALGRSLGALSSLAEATDIFNQRQASWLSSFIQERFAKNSRVGILGLSYKPNSDVAEEAQGILLAQSLAKANIPVVVYDPAALESARQLLNCSTAFAASADECIEKSDVLVITTPWEEFKNLPASKFSRSGGKRVVIDCWRILGHLNRVDGIEYVALGVGDFKL